MISLDEARELIAQQVLRSGDEWIDIVNALDRVLAEEVVADRDYPPFNRATMDGYALRLDDWESGLREYEIAETIFAGQAASMEISSGFCYKIMTGAAVPLSANFVIRVEDSVQAGQSVKLHAGAVHMYMNIARRGEDFSVGQVMIGRHRRLSPQLISLLAVVGRQQVKVIKKPTVAVVTTGDEVVPLGQEVLPHQIRNSNRYLICAMLQEQGQGATFVTHVPDDRERIKAALEQALNSELVIINGGVSAGDADYVPDLLESLQVRKLFHKVAIRPGRPVWIGVKPNGGLVFALPGNPFSCMVTFHLFVKLFLELTQGLEAPGMLKLPFAGERLKKVNLNEFFPVKLDPQTMTLHPVAINGSGDVGLGRYAQGIALHPLEKSTICNGDLVEFFFS